MKKILITAVIVPVSILFHAQQNTSRESYFRDVRFNQDMEKTKNGEKKLGYVDIEGSPYYNPNFLPAKFGNSSEIHPIRYDCVADTVEFLNGNDIYKIPKENIRKDSDLSKFTFEESHETLILVDTYNEFSGYYFLITNGKNQLLKKATIEFHPEVPAPNHLIKAIPARFEKPKTTYFIKTENDFIKIPKTNEEFLNHFSENKDKINDFLKKNKIKLKKESDLIKLASFLNAE